jgi:predicted DNA-binding protein
VKERLDAAARAAGKSSAAWGREILEAALAEAETSAA